MDNDRDSTTRRKPLEVHAADDESVTKRIRGNAVASSANDVADPSDTDNDEDTSLDPPPEPVALTPQLQRASETSVTINITIEVNGERKRFRSV